MIAILNSSIITDWGVFLYKPISEEEIQNLITEEGFESFIGHQATAEIISKLLDINCQANRVSYQQKIGNKAVIFKLKGRPPEGKILSRQEIEEIGYNWGLLTRIA